jgi:hypothetical protein
MFRADHPLAWTFHQGTSRWTFNIHGLNVPTHDTPPFRKISMLKRSSSKLRLFHGRRSKTYCGGDRVAVSSDPKPSNAAMSGRSFTPRTAFYVQSISGASFASGL